MKKSLFSFFLIVLLFFNPACHQPDPDPAPIGISDSEKELPARWADVALRTIRASPPNSPTFTSRNLGYIGVTMYESVVHGSSSHASLAGQLNELVVLPQPEAGSEYVWELSLNAGQAEILRLLYPHSTKPSIIDSLEDATEIEFDVITEDVRSRSVHFGQEIARAVFEWSKTDGGHEGYLYMFDPEYQMQVGAGHWAPPFFGQSASPFPLHPRWGQNRTFVAANSKLPIPQILPYSTSPLSDYYKVFYDVYKKRNSLTDEEKRIAAWWGDDPTQSASPPGHSYNLATIAITTAKSDIFTAAETYAKVGIAVADAFICCWKAKYSYDSERPFPYIIANIDKKYKQFWPEPPFPAFPSGHATQSAAAAIVMESVFGENFAVVDNTHLKRKPDFQGIRYRSREYTNLWETAEECAYSRFLGGIHTQQDNKKGQEQGIAIAQNITKLQWAR